MIEAMDLPLPALPPKVAKAVSDVMAGVEKLGKDENNPHANYKYAGIEQFLEMVRPLCAKAGLIILQDEEGYEFRDSTDKYGKSLTWLVMSFMFGLAHSSGETWPHRIRRTGMVQASMGSQAFGAAQSYAMKSFLRSLELIATGDTEDADSHAQSDLPKNSVTNTALGNETLPKSKSRPVYDALIKEMREFTSKAGLTAWALENTARIYSMHRDFQRFFRDEYGNQLTAIIESVNEDGSPLKAPVEAEAAVAD